MRRTRLMEGFFECIDQYESELDERIRPMSTVGQLTDRA